MTDNSIIQKYDAGNANAKLVILFDFPNPDIYRTTDQHLLAGRSGYAVHQLLNQAGIAVSDCLFRYCHTTLDNKGLINNKGVLSSTGSEIKQHVLGTLKKLPANIIVPAVSYTHLTLPTIYSV